MVNLNKWTEVEHSEVKEGDILKVVVITKGTSPLETKETYKGRVTRISCGDIYLSDHSAWEDVYDDNEKVELYRRNEAYSKPFKLPTELGAVISGVKNGYSYSDDKRVWLVFDGGDWSCSSNAYSPESVEGRFSDLRVERKGIEI